MATSKSHSHFGQNTFLHRKSGYVYAEQMLVGADRTAVLTTRPSGGAHGARGYSAIDGDRVHVGDRADAVYVANVPFVQDNGGQTTVYANNIVCSNSCVANDIVCSTLTATNGMWADHVTLRNTRAQGNVLVTGTLVVENGIATNEVHASALLHAPFLFADQVNLNSQITSPIGVFLTAVTGKQVNALENVVCRNVLCSCNVTVNDCVIATNVVATNVTATNVTATNVTATNVVATNVTAADTVAARTVSAHTITADGGGTFRTLGVADTLTVGGGATSYTLPSARPSSHALVSFTNDGGAAWYTVPTPPCYLSVVTCDVIPGLKSNVWLNTTSANTKVLTSGFTETSTSIENNAATEFTCSTAGGLYQASMTGWPFIRNGDAWMRMTLGLRPDGGATFEPQPQLSLYATKWQEQFSDPSPVQISNSALVRLNVGDSVTFYSIASDNDVPPSVDNPYNHLQWYPVPDSRGGGGLKMPSFQFQFVRIAD